MGNSMFPYLLENEVVKVIPFYKEEAKKGDIIVFKNSDGFVAHRLIDIDRKKNIYITKGDFCIKKDQPLVQQDIIGKISVVYRKDKEIDLNRYSMRIVNLFLARITGFLPFFVKVLRKSGIVKIPGDYFHN